MIFKWRFLIYRKFSQEQKKEGCNQPLSTNLASSNKDFWVSTETPFEISGNLQKFSEGLGALKLKFSKLVLRPLFELIIVELLAF